VFNPLILVHPFPICQQAAVALYGKVMESEESGQPMVPLAATRSEDGSAMTAEEVYSSAPLATVQDRAAIEGKSPPHRR